MPFTYGNSWQNRPEEGEGNSSSSWYEKESNSNFVPKVRVTDPEKEYSITFLRPNGEEIESFSWTLEEFEEEQLAKYCQFTLNGCEYYWVEEIKVDHVAKAIVVNCS